MEPEMVCRILASNLSASRSPVDCVALLRVWSACGLPAGATSCGTAGADRGLQVRPALGQRTRQQLRWVLRHCCRNRLGNRAPAVLALDNPAPDSADAHPPRQPVEPADEPDISYELLPGSIRNAGHRAALHSDVRSRKSQTSAAAVWVLGD